MMQVLSTDFLNYVLSANNDVLEFEMENDDAVLNTVNITAGGADTIRLNNDSVEVGTSVDYVTITGFTTGNDFLDLEVGATNIAGGAFAAVAAGSNTAVAIAANGVIEIAGSNTISAATATDTADGGNVELAIAAAVGAVTNAGNYGVVLYGDGNAYIYTATFTAADATAATTTVELVGVLNGVGLGALGGADFV